MRKSIMVFLLLAALFFVTSCGTKIEGTWYSDRPDNETLTLNPDGTYIGGGWLNAGRYTVEGDKITLTGLLDGAKTLRIKKEGSITVLYFDNGPYSHTYYANKEIALEEIKHRKEEAAREQEELLVELSPGIMGYWVSENRGPLELRNNGECYYFNGAECFDGTYECEIKMDLESHPQEITLKVTLRDGARETWSIDLESNHLQNRVGEYQKAEKIELTKDMLIGRWNNFYGTYIFTDETYTRKASFEKDITWNYELDGDVLRRVDEGVDIKEKIYLMEVNCEPTLVMMYTRPSERGGYSTWEILTQGE